jgi:predicted RNA-binding Zn-ribbon protein involved in translation (DUF1610 family)
MTSSAILDDDAPMTLRPCPNCGSANILPEFYTDPPYGLYCHECGHVGPRVSTDAPDEAIAAWNAQEPAA